MALYEQLENVLVLQKQLLVANHDLLRVNTHVTNGKVQGPDTV
jgi:hypothetical protein